jgi:outer membrane protein TolC
VLQIDLPAALRLANVASPTIGVAQARVREAYARLQLAQVMWIPNLETGPVYNRHDGLNQSSHGDIFAVSKWNLLEGGGMALSVETSDALFAPLIARRLVDAQIAQARGVTNDVQLDVALAYFDLLQAYGALAINKETLANAEEWTRLAEAAERNGFGKTPADANRGRTEVNLRRQERMLLEGQVLAASARLNQLLFLDPTAQLKPADQAVVPISIVPSDSPLSELVGTGLMTRPELEESRAIVAASLAQWRQARTRPFLPRLEASYVAGYFGGGINDNTQQFGGRGDGTAGAVWTLRNFGTGDLAQARATKAQYDQANLHVLEVQARIGAEIAAAANLALSRQRTLDSAQEAVQQAEEMWRRLYRWTIEVGLKARQYEAVELFLAEQSLNTARTQYLEEVIQFTKQQFRLYWALGQPPLEALPKMTALPKKVPVHPPDKPAATKP